MQKPHRTPDYLRLIRSHRWRRLRRAYLTEHPLCEDCLKADRARPATEVHHIRPIESAAGRREQMTSLCFDPMNLRALCHPCHVEAHRALASASKEVAKERAKEALDAFTERFLKE